MKRFWKHVILMATGATVVWTLMWAGPVGAQDSRLTFMNRQRDIARDLEIDTAPMEPSEDSARV